VFWGEVDLNGQIRPVFGHDVRRKQAQNLGYSPLIHPKTSEAKTSGWGRLLDVQHMLFGAPSAKYSG